MARCCPQIVYTEPKRGAAAGIALLAFPAGCLPLCGWPYRAVPKLSFAWPRTGPEWSPRAWILEQVGDPPPSPGQPALKLSCDRPVALSCRASSSSSRQVGRRVTSAELCILSLKNETFSLHLVRAQGCGTGLFPQQRTLTILKYSPLWESQDPGMSPTVETQKAQHCGILKDFPFFEIRLPVAP